MSRFIDTEGVTSPAKGKKLSEEGAELLVRLAIRRARSVPQAEREEIYSATRVALKGHPRWVSMLDKEIVSLFGGG